MIDLTAFVPRLAAELAVDERSTYTEVDGSMLSADISGFTALSEKLAGKGKAGAEEITELINVCFTALIDAAYGYGGEIIKFGGDALLVLFRGEHHGRRCANAALAMQIALHSSPTAKRANLTMTVGASHGPFDVFLAGTDYRELLIIGPAASQVIHLEGEADKGETLVSDEIAATVPASMLGRRHAGGVALLGNPPDSPSVPEVRQHGSARMEAFVPPQVLEQLSAFTELGGEHRLVSVGFVMVGGVEAALHAAGPDGTATVLGALVDDVIAATLPYGVTALHTDIAPDGFKFVLCAGAPVNPGDISDALLQASLAIAAIDSRFTLRQGAQTGRVFAGFLGAPYRRTYTLMGDPVNTAARMLGKAGDREIVAVGSMVDDTRSVFDAEQLEPFRVKGKTEPIIAYQVRGITDGVRRDGTHTHLVGRERELEVLSKAIGELGEIIDIVGPAGVGKSRLLDAAWDEAEGLVHLHGSCAPYGATSPYSVFRPLLRGSLGIDLRADPRSAGAHLSAVVERRAPQLLPRLPLLAVPFGADVASTPEVDAIDPEFRRARIHEAIVDLYDTTLAGRPVFMVIEDLHWVDDASGELVNHLVRAAASRAWAGVTTRRPEGTWEMDNQLPHVTTIELQPLTDDDIRRVAIEASERSLSDGTLDLIVERSQGNPLFALELTRAAGRGEVAQLPDSVEKVISSRIDELGPGLRRLVRVAAVFGNSFDVDDLAPVLEQIVAAKGIDDPGLAGIIEHRSGATWAFRHALYRDAAYEGLPFRQRQNLHGAVANSLEQRASDPSSIAGLLSLHFHEARDRAKTWHYSLIAGRKAASAGANADAAASLRRALSLAPRGIAAHERAQTYEKLGDASWSAGQLTEASTAFARSRRHFASLADELRVRRKIGGVRENEGRQSVALQWYSRALAEAHRATSEPEVKAQVAHLLLATAGVRHRQGDNESCASLAREAQLMAEESGDDRALALAHGRQRLASAFMGTGDDEGHGPAALELYQRLGDAAGEARVLNNMGIAAYFAGDWERTTELYAAAVERSEAAGDVVLAGIGAVNQAEILADQGHWTRALGLLDNVIRNWQAIGYEPGVAVALSFRGTALGRAGDHDAAAADLDDALRRSQQIGVTSLIAGARLRLAELALLQGQIAECTDMLDLLDEMPESGQSDIGRRSHVTRAIAMLSTNAEAGIAALKALESGAEDYDEAVALAILDRMLPAAEGRGAELAARLGIVAFPEVTLPDRASVSAAD
jgi:class 3 adenylate cyclase/tetratricopeptide (TPR) repeat protein